MPWIETLRSWIGATTRNATTHPELVRALSGDPVDYYSGVSVTLDSVLALPDVKAAMRVIADGVASTSILVQQRVDGRWRLAEGHGLYEILGSLANPETTAVEHVDQIIRDLLTYGVCYSQIVRNARSEVTALWRLDPQYMTESRDASNVKVWTYRLPNAKVVTFRFNPDTPPLWVMRRESPLDLSNRIWPIAIAVDVYSQLWFGNSARFSGVFSTPEGKFTPDQITEIRKQINALHGGLAKSHGFAVLGHDFKYTPVALPNATDAQLLEVRAFVRSVIAAQFGLSPTLLGDLTKASYSSLEYASRELAGNLEVYLKLIEQSARRDLLSTKSYNGTRIFVDRDDLIAVTLTDKVTALSTAANSGLLQINECRAKLGYDPLPDGDVRLINGNITTVSAMLAKSTANTA